MGLYELRADDSIGRMVELENVPNWVATVKRALTVQCNLCRSFGTVTAEEVHVQDQATGKLHRFLEINGGGKFDHECRPHSDGSQRG